MLALSLAEGIHKFLQLRTPLDLEEDFIIVISNLDVEVLNRSRHGLRGKIGHFFRCFQAFECRLCVYGFSGIVVKDRKICRRT